MVPVHPDPGIFHSRPAAQSQLKLARCWGGHHDADEKAPRFLHVWLGGASQTALGRNITGYTLLTHDDLATYNFSEECKTALTATIACATTTMHWTSPAYRGSLGNATLQDEVCDVGCGTSLASWYQQVSASCADFRWPSSGAVLEMAGGYIWYGYNESCSTDSKTGRYCNDVIGDFSVFETLDGVPDSELCSDCFTARIRMMQQSATRYTTRSRGTSEPSKPSTPAARWHSPMTVSSADVVDAAQVVGDVVGGCSGLPVGMEICLPLTCTTYSVLPTDSCMTISGIAGIRDLQLYNRWIDQSCDNLHEAKATLGYVVCISPVGGAYVPGTATVSGTATNTPGVPHDGSAGTSPIAVAPPANAIIASGTIKTCGRWHVAEEGDTCAYISMAYKIGFDLLAGMNPSIENKTADKSWPSIVPGYAYCVSLVRAPPPTPRPPYTPKSLGYWLNPDKSTRILRGTAWANDGVTIETCAKESLENGYDIAGIDSRSSPPTCICGDLAAPNTARLSKSACTADEGINLYALREYAKLSVPFEPVGCFADAALLTDAGDGTPAPSNTDPVSVARCSAFCFPEYPFFGLSNGNTCRCGTGMAEGATPLPELENCNLPCSARGDMTCGGAEATHIYAAQVILNND
ncbi:hypothetical protein CHGG_01317 [Chaetomium globosum CBS 148.51]|uniref:WSC domain-containing protein n=1 Tax=Chaetomium globosum (strain ATCC 6205 / CBS 148.51 / DSM 1962 / NBRC 6347 / NRRL 1970) TaxID=306901 RepID=Q2HEN7_CHAGB|nr:uncharacterized protein CHGG_01317 [Chaetomium globosum CBS 148.51]EAQ93082.1 hypothetical protein CHGG_01317 [Chaetomium globosum CBS 148.51]